MHFSNAIYYRKDKIKYLPIATYIAGFINITLNILFINKWGIVGAASATAIAAFVHVSIILIIGQKIYHIPYNYWRILSIITLTIGVILYSYMNGVMTGYFSRIGILILFILIIGSISKTNYKSVSIG